MSSVMDFTPFIPSEQALEETDLPDRVMRLTRESASLGGGLAPQTFETIRRHMSVINSYCSNLIEGSKIHPHDIRQAQAGNYSSDPAKRDLQIESVAHIGVQEWIFGQKLSVGQVFSADFIQELHRKFYEQLPESLRLVRDEQSGTEEMVEPGQWRQRPVSVGRHLPPVTDDMGDLVDRFCQTYSAVRYRGTQKTIAVLCAHHRLLWIHPFLDGNGRVARLWLDASLKAIDYDSYGLWCIARGLARTSDQYKAALASADIRRNGDRDGRGQLSEEGLIRFCSYMLEQALDQVEYMTDLLDLNSIRQRINAYIKARNEGLIDGGTGTLKPTASTVLFNTFITGEMERGEALEAMAMPERSARRQISLMREEGLLVSDSKSAPLRWAIPEHAEPWLFPDLFK